MKTFWFLCSNNIPLSPTRQQVLGVQYEKMLKLFFIFLYFSRSLLAFLFAAPPFRIPFLPRCCSCDRPWRHDRHRHHHHTDGQQHSSHHTLLCTESHSAFIDLYFDTHTSRPFIIYFITTKSKDRMLQSLGFWRPAELTRPSGRLIHESEDKSTVSSRTFTSSDFSSDYTMFYILSVGIAGITFKSPLHHPLKHTVNTLY